MKTFLLAAAAMASCASTASAQSDYSMSPVQFPSSFNFNVMAQVGKVYVEPSTGGPPSSRAPATVATPSTSFNASLTRRKANLAAFVAKSRASDPQGAAGMERLFASTDIIAAMGQELAKYDLRTDNVADCYAVWWISAWQGANGDTSDAARATAQAVKAQAARALAATPQFLRATEAQKQEYAEAMLIQAALISATVDTYKSDPAMMRKVATAIRTGAKASGLDLDAMRLTPAGFVPNGPAARAPAQKIATPRAAASAAPALQGGAIWTKTHMTIFRQWGDLEFHPTVLFTDGTSMDIDDASLETTDLAAAHRARPGSWGTWRREGARYFLTDDKGNVSDYTLGGGGMFRAFPAAAGATLSGRYKSVSGSTMGEMSMLSTRGITFAPDGRFTMKNSFAASGSGADTGVSMAGGGESGFEGRYTLSGNRIVLRFADGKVKDLFFGFGSQGTPPRADRDMMFLGFTAYVLDD
jgi:hypothetical protein